MKHEILKEITPLTSNDCFTLFKREKKDFDFPLHYHEEFELNFIKNAKDARRVVGNSIENIDDLELVLIGPNIHHAWFTHECHSEKITEITIQFHKDLFDDKFLKRNQLSFIKKMFDMSYRGILFSRETIKNIESRIFNLSEKTGFDSMLELMSVLHDLSISRNYRTLTNVNLEIQLEHQNYQSRRIEKVLDYIEKNYNDEVALKDVAKIANMSEGGFCRFFKQKTGTSFVDNLLEIRLGHASRMLIDTTNTVSEIAYNCGFNNVSNFNRIFKKKKKCTPKEFRSAYLQSGTRTFI